MIILILAIAAGGLAASRMIPVATTGVDRRMQSDLRFVLGQIRNASDLLKRTDPSYVVSLPDRNAINNFLQELRNRNFLARNDPQDPTIPAFQWSNVPGPLMFWVSNGSNGILGNRSFNSSFESTVSPTAGEIVASWGTVFGTNAGTSTFLLSDSEVDDYHFQNKLGQVMATSGWSIGITH